MAREDSFNKKHVRMSENALCYYQNSLVTFSDASSTVSATPQGREPSQGSGTVWPESELWGIPQSQENVPVCGRFPIELCCMYVVV